MPLMTLKERVKHLEAWYDRQAQLIDLSRSMFDLNKKVEALAEYHGLKIVTKAYTVEVIKKGS